MHFAGPVKGKMLMVVLDAHSKWPEIFMMENTTAEETVNTLKVIPEEDTHSSGHDSQHLTTDKEPVSTRVGRVVKPPQ